MEFEFNFGQKTLAQGITKNERIYASVDGVALQLSDEEIVFMDKSTGKNHVMTHQVLQALGLCQQFKPLDQHVKTISMNMPKLSNQVHAIQQVTKFLIDNKLLIEDKTWKKDLTKQSIIAQIKESGIVIRSCDRPKQLNRMLKSLLKYQNQFKTAFNIQIFDDSTTEKLETEIENICIEFKSDLNITFFGSAWQLQFINMLKSEFVDNIETINWLLAKKQDTFTGGRVWNLALLNNAGKKFLFFDDDYIFEPRVLNDNKKKLDLNDRPDLRVGFSLNLSDIRQSSVIYQHDILTEMLDSCGKSVGNWLTDTEIEFSSLENISLLELQRINSKSVIKSTGNGTWGSPRSNSNYWLYYLQGEQKKEFWKSREVYLDNIEASSLIHYSDNYEFLSITNFSPSAIDNSSMTPFAAPQNRVEDHFFNAVSLFCYPDQVSLHYPFMMGHIQANTRNRSSTNHIARRPNFNKFVADYSLTLLKSTDAVNPQLRLKTLAKYIMGLADSSDMNINNRLKEYLSQVRSDMVLSMQQQLAASPNAPVYWQADVRELIEANGKAVLSNNAPVLGDWDSKLNVQQCVDLARTELINIAEAMEVWPDLWEFCQTNK